MGRRVLQIGCEELGNRCTPELGPAGGICWHVEESHLPRRLLRSDKICLDATAPILPLDLACCGGAARRIFRLSPGRAERIGASGFPRVSFFAGAETRRTRHARLSRISRLDFRLVSPHRYRCQCGLLLCDFCVVRLSRRSPPSSAQLASLRTLRFRATRRAIRREFGRKTTCTAAVPDADPRSKHHRRDPIGPRVSTFPLRTFQPIASSPRRQDYRPARPHVEARQQNLLGWCPTGREKPSLRRSKRAAPPVCPKPVRARLQQMNLRQRRSLAQPQLAPQAVRRRQRTDRKALDAFFSFLEPGFCFSPASAFLNGPRILGPESCAQSSCPALPW